MNERDRLDTADIYACPFTAELSKAVSVSLGLDTVSSPLSSTNLCSVRAFADCDPTVGNSSRGAPELEAAGNMNLEGDVLPLDDTSLRKDDFGQVCHGTQQVSCMDLLTSGDLDGAQTLTRGPVMSRFLCQESNWFINPAAELYTPSPQVDELLPLKSYSASSRLYRDTPGMWCANERAYGVRSETEKEGSGGHNLSCNYCNCGQATLGSRRECHCAWYNKGEQGGEGGMRAAMTQGYGQMERYHSAVPQEQATSAIKTERAVWMNCTDRTFRHDDMFPGVYLSERRVCQVCGDDASGCHYGAVTCGSCKVFFKRAAAGKQNHLCAGRNDCTIDKLRRKNCASCRLKRCYMLGMSLKGRRLKAAGQARTREEEEPPAAREPGVIGEMAWKTDFMLKPGSTAVRAKAAFPALSMSPTLRSCLSLLSILQSIEPAVVNAGHDPAQPDSPVALLSSLNELGERQLVAMVRWAKAIPGFRDLHVDDQMSLIQLSWMGLMVFALGWRSYTFTNSSMLYFAPDLVFNDHRMQVSTMYEHCMRMRLLAQRLCMLKVTQEEFLCMKALILFSIIPLEGLKSQRCFDKLRASYINELDRLASLHGEATEKERLFQLTQLLDYLQAIVRQLHQFTYDLFTQARSMQIHVKFPEMISEIVSVHVPKVVTGMVKTIPFHSAAKEMSLWSPELQHPAL